MIKYCLIVLGIILVAVGVYFIASGQKINLPAKFFQSQTITQPTVSPVDTSDDSLDNDLTALEKDLMELDSSEPDLTDALKEL